MIELDSLRFDSAEEFRAWLAQNCDSSPGIWLIIAKKGAAAPTVTYAEAVDIALRHGWIDGQAQRLDDESYKQRFTPRRPQSPWSLKNRRAAEAMIEEGGMSPRGLAEVERARADGRWDRAYEGQKDATPHPDFLAALEANPAAAQFYATLNGQNRFAVYFRIHSVKRAETRAKKIDTIVAMLARGEKFYD
ncbi:YdeI/OmpD-associated family protein [Compostimonas suwonensis]|uniref:Uncharacterized protein YdeI (YjbR/CyaY-like superfamily) n=1 Tax=Compostimonas suwonensis TaxID=1048394 RepID=A0A2M9C3E7_9MICO|nr:YdeI/OmpD-associated family protein [Compostimonas suwonensis]PJJ65063.1 uncharacterized protein YdeI (YjbR/CyaY-like superfamily) [Compostimonas suwonensis]